MDLEMKSMSNIIVLLSIIIVFANPLPPQNLEEESDFPLTIPFIKIYDKDTTYRTTWNSRSIPLNRGYKIDKYIFNLLITITVVGKETWDKPFALVYELPVDKKEFIIINEERFELTPDSFHDFLVEVRTKQIGWAKFELAVYDELKDSIYVPINSYPLRRKDFLLE